MNNYMIILNLLILDIQELIERWRLMFCDSFVGIDGVSLTYPNFEAELWWTTLIPFVGTPRYKSF